MTATDLGTRLHLTSFLSQTDLGLEVYRKSSSFDGAIDKADLFMRGEWISIARYLIALEERKVKEIGRGLHNPMAARILSSSTLNGTKDCRR